MNKSLLVIFFFVLAIESVSAQTINYDWIKTQPLNYVNQLPEDISQTKSIAIVISSTREKGEVLANEFHPAFVKSGIDPVSYYHVDDLFANEYISEELVKEFIKREIKYLIIINHSFDGYVLVIATFSASNSFIDVEKSAWRLQNTEIKTITRTLYSQAYSLKRKNYLVVDQPEFRVPDVMIKGQRFEAYKPDLRSETLYVPLFQPILLDSTIQYAENTLLAINNYNNRITKKNQELITLFSTYPFPHEFISKNSSDEELMKNNVRYLLQSIHTTNESIRSILNFKEKTIGVTEYITVTAKEGASSIKRIPTSSPVYKYFIKHLPSNSFYLGTKWDTDITWQESLQNHLKLLEAEIKP